MNQIKYNSETPHTCVRECSMVPFFRSIYRVDMGFPGDAVVQDLPANTGDTRDAFSNSGLERYHGVGNGNPL